MDVRCAPSSARPRGRRACGSRASPPARRGTGRRPSPSGSSRRCAAQAARTCARIPSGSKFAASSRTSVVVVRDLALLAAHDRCESDRPLAVGDEEVVGVEAAQRAVERAQLLAGARAADDDAPAGELRAVEGMQRAALHVHDVVRHVDDVRDRAHLGEMEPRAQPLRRRADRDVAEHAADVARAAARSPRRRRPRAPSSTTAGSSISGGWSSPPSERRDLPRKPHHRQQVDAVHGRRRRRAPGRGSAARRRAASRLDRVGQDHDPRVVVAETDLVLGEDHPA